MSLLSNFFSSHNRNAERQKLIDEDNFLKVLAYAVNSRGNGELVESCLLETESIRVNDENQKEVIICYKGIEYTVTLKPTTIARKFGKLNLQSDEASVYYHKYDEDGMESFLRYVNTIFDPHPNKRQSFTGTGDIRKTLLVYDSSKIFELKLSKAIVTIGEMEYIKDNFPNIKKFDIKVTEALPVCCQSMPMEYRDVRLKYPKTIPIKISHITNMRCETLVIANSSITSSTLNEFVKLWSYNEYEWPLKEFHVHLSESDDLLNGLPYTEWNENKRHRFHESGIDCEHGYDITQLSPERATTQPPKIATIVLEDGWFRFLVWHRRFPDQPDS